VVDSWPHRWAMASDRTAPKAGASTERQARIEAEREAKLARALRANLRRRKVEARSSGEAEPSDPVPESGPESAPESGDGDSA